MLMVKVKPVEVIEVQKYFLQFSQYEDNSVVLLRSRKKEFSP